jgi:general secretion pathway protein E
LPHWPGRRICPCCAPTHFRQSARKTPALNTGFLLAHNLLPLGPALEGAEPPAFASADPRSETLRSALRLVFGAVPTLVFGLETEIAGRLNEWYVQAAQDDEEAVPWRCRGVRVH